MSKSKRRTGNRDNLPIQKIHVTRDMLRSCILQGGGFFLPDMRAQGPFLEDVEARPFTLRKMEPSMPARQEIDRTPYDGHDVNRVKCY